MNNKNIWTHKDDLKRAQRAMATAVYASAAANERRIEFCNTKLGWGNITIEDGKVILNVTAKVDPLPKDDDDEDKVEVVRAGP